MSKNKLIGKWRIIEMELWGKEFIDAEVEGYIDFIENNTGEFHFGYVHGFMDCRYLEDNMSVEFSWEGNDEMDEASGRGNATLKNGKLLGSLFFHNGDDSEFKAIGK